jgi:hypothetical protein
MGPFVPVYSDFLLGRILHDLANSISGIVSLSEYHLRQGVDDPSLDESLKLIHDSAEGSCALLIAAGNLRLSAEEDEELIRAEELIRETGKILSLLLPRSIKFETELLAGKDQVISVRRVDFSRRILALAAMDLSGLKIPSGSIRLSGEADSTTLRLIYHSVVCEGVKLREQADSFFANIGRAVQVSSQIDGNNFTLVMAFPLVKL